MSPCDCFDCKGACGRSGNTAHADYCCAECEYTDGREHSDECAYDFDDGCKQRGVTP